MRIGIFGSETRVDDVIDAVRGASEQGFATYWLPQMFGLDALTILGVAGREVPRIELGTSVVPTYPRHPLALASQALTTQALTGGRLVLGVGLSHRIVIESMFGYTFTKPVRHMREYLTVLGPLLRGESVSFRGESVSASGAITVPDAAPVPVLVAALGEQMLQVTARLAEGTVTWMTGPATLARHTVPVLTSAAREAGRKGPLRVVAGLPVCVTDDPDSARERAAKIFSIYGQLPSYRAMLDREGAAGPADLAIVGPESVVRAEIQRVREAGVTDFAAAEFGSNDAERKRTREVLRDLLTPTEGR